MIPPARTPQQRKQDTLDRLGQDVDAWVATADPATGTPWLVPLSFLWDGHSLLVATPASSPTGRNLQATGRARSACRPGGRSTSWQAVTSCATGSGRCRIEP
jgi:hypothetical protein